MFIAQSNFSDCLIPQQQATNFYQLRFICCEWPGLVSFLVLLLLRLRGYVLRCYLVQESLAKMLKQLKSVQSCMKLTINELDLSDVRADKISLQINVISAA